MVMFWDVIGDILEIHNNYATHLLLPGFLEFLMVSV